ncbi:putative S-adenosyl-L-methionine-dependent methyltransferase protein [Corchorus capsularis]|uniref:Methyltransferase n=1 Tax=Corchorus capsularis TaxID=210143 RepID=A0A1R3ITX3_COCAP|nr:putative S-adenosyl-L-methionine-dependent methyltransferase protein [Corchorus capsularis]
MAAGSNSSYQATSKPIKVTSSRKRSIFSLAFILCLCTFISLPCIPNPNSTATSDTLDFSTHHVADADTESVLADNVKTYPSCSVKYSEYTPCEDQKRSLKFKRERLIYRERHCPDKTELLKCRVPAPYGYRNPFRWPKSRDLAWFANVPHKELTVEKAGQNWIRYEGKHFRFPGGGTMFPHGANKYIDDIGRLINLEDGSIRTAIDTGCGVASWGAYLLSRNIITMSFAPRDTHEAQVQFALERGVPAMLGVLSSKRLPYPSRAFDMAHCSRCLIPWHLFDGLYLIEVDRVLRPGGYWILSGPPIRWKKYWKGWERTREDLNDEQTRIETVAKSLCWKKLVESGDIAIWQKPINHLNCKVNRKLNQNPPFCPAQDPDRAWYTNLETCLTHLPEVSNNQETAGGQLAKWPERLNAIPPRISKGTVNGITAEIFRQDSEIWKKRLSYYKTVNNQLGQHGRCEAMSTYPRTYDFIHADSVFSLYENRCEMEDILLEMDRVLRPEGSVIFRDDVDMLVKIKKIADGLNWDSQIVDHEDGPLNREKLLFAVKVYWTAPASAL